MTTEETRELATVVGEFQYPDQCARQICEDAAQRIEEVNALRVRFTVMCRLEVGRQLNAVRDLLGYGRYGEWLAWRLPDWSEEATRRWRVLAERVDKRPKLLEMLEPFRSTKAAEEFVGLPEPVQQQVVEREAYGWNQFKAVCWRAAMEERLADGGLQFSNRHGDVLHAIEDARDDPALAQEAEELYLEHRDTFARLEGESPAVVDVEVGIEWKEPTGRPSAQLVEADEGYWLCRRVEVNGREEYWPIAPVSSHVLLWNGGAQPVVLAAFPTTTDGPAATSWQRAGVRALCERLGASTLASVYGEAL